MKEGQASSGGASRKVSMRAVAERAGVSVQTVSKVANNRPGVSLEVRDRIKQIMREMNFHVNIGARSLKTGMPAAIGLINVDRSGYGPLKVANGVERAARASSYYVTVAGLPRVTVADLQDSIDRLASMSVAGIVINVPVASGSQIFDRLVTDIPLVGIWAPSETPFPVATYDHRAAGALATQHLLDLGHTTVHHLGGEPTQSGAQLRAAGWQDALDAAGAPVPEILWGEWTGRSGYERGRRLAADPSVSAVFAATDYIAYGLITALRQAGRDIPGDVSVVGYDDLPESAYYSPPLTVIHQDFDALGERAAALLIARLNGSSPDQVPPAAALELVVRESTAPPK